MFQTIVVPLDGSDLARQALPVAARLARALGSTLYLVRVTVSPFSSFLPVYDFPLYLPRVEQEDHRRATAYLEQVAEAPELSGITITTNAFDGDPATAILETAHQRPAPLIVVSSHGDTGIKRWMLGSVATKIVHHSQDPVLLLRPDGSGSLLEPSRALRWLVPLDGSLLSKRHDPEASVGYYIEQGFPVEAVQYYLRGLANGRLAELPLAQALAEPLRLAEFGVAGPLVDLVKLDDICADFVASLRGDEIVDRVLAWADVYDADLAAVLRSERPLALRALSVERGEGVANPRKDLRKWADFRTVYGYFFPEVFEPVADPADARFGKLGADLVRALADGFATGYVEPGPEVAWFDQVRSLAAGLGFAPSQKVYKKDPDAYPGSIADASAVIRVLITGTRQSPDLAAICAALGREEVLRRAGALTKE